MSAYKVRINTHTADNSAIILLADGVLLGILSELVDECHAPDQGKWAIETVFGIAEERIPAVFASAGQAANWLSAQVGGGTFNLDGDVPELH